MPITSRMDKSCYIHNGIKESESDVAQSCPTLCDPMDCSLPCSLPVSSIYGILQARILEWVAISFSIITGCYPAIRRNCWYMEHGLIHLISCCMTEARLECILLDSIHMENRLNRSGQKSEERLPLGPIWTRKGQEVTLCDAENVLYLVISGGSTGIYIKLTQFINTYT